MNLLPNISDKEKIFLREVLSGNTRADSWRVAFDPEEKIDDANKVSRKADALFKRSSIQIWYQYLQNATPEELIEQKYLENIAFGNSRDSMAAAGAYLDSRFAGKEVAEIFLRTLKEIHAEIRVYCGEHKQLESVKL